MLAEFGLVASKSPEKLREKLTEMLEDASNDLSGLARLVIQEAYDQWKYLDKRIEWCDERISAHVKDDAQAKAAKELMGVGPVTASAVVAIMTKGCRFDPKHVSVKPVGQVMMAMA